MTEYKKYSEYKDSDVEWLGQVPASWKLQSLKKNASLVSHKKSIPNFTLAMENIESWTGNLVGDFSKEYENTGIHFVPSYILFGKLRPYLAKVWLADREGSAVGDFYIIKGNKNYYPKYLKYLLASPTFIDLVNSSTYGAKMPRASWSFMGNVVSPLPPLNIQQKIVEFLDKETTHIDAGIANMESLIALLTEKRAALISETVTRGIPGEHTEFKDSGVDWLGEIPESRKLVITGRILKAQKEVVGSNHIEYDLLSLTKKGVIFRDKNSGIGKFPESFDTYQVVHPENLVFCLFDTEETPRTIGLVHQEGMITGAYTRFAVNKNLAKPEFLENYFIAIDDKKGFKPLYTGLRKTIQKPRFLASKVPLPSLEEQDRIVSYIKKNTKEIDLAITNAISVTNLMKEKRQVLISDAVTGKIDVSQGVN